MENKNLERGIIFGLLGAFLIGLQPIVANSIPMIIDAYLFAAMTTSVEALIFFPLALIERRKIKLDFENEKISTEELNSLLHGYKRNVPLLIFVGGAFGFGMFLFFTGYALAGAINGSLAQKTALFFSLLFGSIILHEKITKKQIGFSILLFFGLFVAVSQGSFNLLELNAGVLVLLLLACIWVFAHTISKPILDRKESTAIQMICIRNGISGIILLSTYFLFFPLENISLFYDLTNIYFFVLMGFVYGCGLFCWYKTLTYLDISKASVLVSPTPVITAIFATMLLGENFTVYHLIGTCIVMFSIYMIVRDMR